MKVIVTYVTGSVPNLPWWRALSMTSDEIKAYNDKFLKYETKEFDDASLDGCSAASSLSSI
jgi:hypothetical protein